MAKYTKEQLQEIQQQLRARQHRRYIRELVKTMDKKYGDYAAPLILPIPKLLVVGDLKRAKKDYRSALIYYVAVSDQVQEKKKGVFVIGRDGWTLKQCQGMLVSRLERLLDQMQTATSKEKLPEQQRLEMDRSIDQTARILMQYH